MSLKPHYAPPAQKNPTIVNVPQGFYSGTFGTSEDVIFNFPNTVRFSEFISNGGRHVRTIGGSTTKNPGGSAMQFVGCTGSIFVEGHAFDMNACPGDAINACGSQAAPYTSRPDVYIQNCRILNVNGANPPGADADIFQAQGAIENLYVDLVTASSNYQGFSLFQNQAPMRSAMITRTNLTYTSGGSPVTYLFWDQDAGSQPPFQHVTLDEFYVTPRTGQNLSQVVWPNPGAVDAKQDSIGAITRDGWATAEWPPATNITGYVTAGQPTGGDFCPLGTPGLNYLSPGYA